MLKGVLITGCILAFIGCAGNAAQAERKAIEEAAMNASLRGNLKPVLEISDKCQKMFPELQQGCYRKVAETYQLARD